MEFKVVTFSRFSPQNLLRKLGNINMWVDSSHYNYVEMAYHIWLLSVVDHLVAINHPNT